ncbi:Uncharacterised protein [Mycobacterium tuberculosis]|uniref:Uncharacterized protein n=2 Tax=Mycobacterium tuberculosis TaxID=1773 RepID=A0A655ICE6_MYCTX|nr:Uncharacterised protein [Mycobacterium tuberculosis]CNV28277.1 Uncharacterised protein [Mycobacterium tuberculosis]COV76862.1 Uncharacterised protein [Mycobacterium tuberculosis]
MILSSTNELAKRVTKLNSRRSSRTGPRHSASAADKWSLACSKEPAAAARSPADLWLIKRATSYWLSATASRYPGGALAKMLCESAPVVLTNRRKFETYVYTVARDPSGRSCSQAASINESIPTGRLR